MVSLGDLSAMGSNGKHETTQKCALRFEICMNCFILVEFYGDSFVYFISRNPIW